MNDQSAKVVRRNCTQLNQNWSRLGGPEFALQRNRLSALAGDGGETRVDDELMALVAVSVVVDLLAAVVLGLRTEPVSRVEHKTGTDRGLAHS